MKKWALGVLFLGLLCGIVQAQVTVDISLEQEQFLPGEDLPVAVRITNRTGRTLRLGAPEDWLTFSVEGENSSEIVSQTGEVPVAGEFDLESGKVAVKRANLAPYFDLSRQGKYTVNANLRILTSQQVEIVSHGKAFYVGEGARLWDRNFGIPNPNGTTNEVRKYVLQQSGQIKGKLRLYFRLMDAQGYKTLKIFPVGTLLSFSRLDPQLDRDSNLHLLYQSGPTSYSYTVFNPDGDLLIRRVYEITYNSRPRLTSDDDGNIRVTGGARRETKSDFPPEAPKPAAPIDPTLTNGVGLVPPADSSNK